MLPTIRPGSFVTFKKELNYKIGDIIVFSVDSKYIVHRVVAFTGDLVLTRGDNNTRNDGYVEKEFIRGKVISVKGESKNIYELYSLSYIKVRQIFFKVLIKTKNFVFQNSNRIILKLFLYVLYKIQIFMSVLYFKFFEKSNLYVRGSYVSNNLKPGLSDIDFVVLLDNSVNIKSLVNSLKKLSYISPMISFNSLLPVKIYEKLFNNRTLEDYKSNVVKKLSGGLEVNTSNLVSASKELLDLNLLLTKVRLIDELMFKFSQIGIYHSSYLFHNIQKILKKLFVVFKESEELKELKTFIEVEASGKTIRKDLPKYAKVLEVILNDIKLPKFQDIAIDTSNSFDIEINGNKYTLYQSIRRLDTYILQPGFNSSNILDILLYTIENRTYPTSISISTEEIASYLQRYNSYFILEKDFAEKDTFAMKFLNDSVLILNHFQILKEKDRFDVEKTSLEIILLSIYFISKKDPVFKVSSLLQKIIDSPKHNEDLNSEQFYYKHILSLNELYLMV
jgi:signal peptidase I